MSEITASNSITVTRLLRNPCIKLIRQLTKFYGVQADIYELRNQANPRSDLQSFYDDLQNYNTVPYLQVKVLIPSLFRRRGTNPLSILDPYSMAEENYLYHMADEVLKLNSLVVCRLKSGKIFNYRIAETQTISNDAGEITYKYLIVPVTSMSLDFNLNEIKDNALKEQDAIDNGEMNNYSTTQSDFNAKNEYSYSPLD